LLLAAALRRFPTCGAFGRYSDRDGDPAAGAK
jgi:hypothetical protein